MVVFCRPAKWKREEIADHKFDYVDVDDFTENSIFRKFTYSFVFLFTLKSILVYMADLGVVILVFASGALQAIIDNDPNASRKYPMPGVTIDGVTNTSSLSKFFNLRIRIAILSLSILLSFILLAIEWRKASKIIKSKDISYAFTSTVAYRYYTIRSYPHYCFFSQIQNSRKTVDLVAFFIFFRFKGWKRLLLAEFPRQFLNALNLADILENLRQQYRIGAPSGIIDTITTYADVINRLSNASYNPSSPSFQLYLTFILTSITFLIWAVSVISVVIAFFLYIPLLCNIQGNLKEYCVHKVDKRIGELLRRRSRKRIQEARKAEMMQAAQMEANQSTIGSNGTQGGGRKARPPMGLNQAPTLPSVDVDLTKTHDSPVSTYPVSTMYSVMPSTNMSQYNQYTTGAASQYGASTVQGSVYGSEYAGSEYSYPVASYPGGYYPAAQYQQSQATYPEQQDDMKSEVSGPTGSVYSGGAYRVYQVPGGATNNNNATGDVSSVGNQRETIYSTYGGVQQQYYPQQYTAAQYGAQYAYYVPAATNGASASHRAAHDTNQASDQKSDADYDRNQLYTNPRSN